VGADSKFGLEIEEAAEKCVPERRSRFVENDLTDKIIGAAIEVHRHRGPGLLESAYEACLCYELAAGGLQFRRQEQLPVAYKGLRLDCGYRMDLLVEDTVVVELKSIDELLPIHSAQVLTYLKASEKRVGLLINFNVPVLKKGLKRIVNRYAGPSPVAKSSAPSVPDAEESRKTRAENPSHSRFSQRDSPRLRVSAVNWALDVDPAKEPA
jgi:GxxExxY protein